MEKAIVTGANGFVGSWLIKNLVSHGVEVIAVVRDKSSDISQLKEFSKISLVYCDLSDMNNLPSLIKDRGFDAFYHLAWMSAGGVGRTDYNIQIKNVKYCCDAVIVAKALDCKAILLAGTISERLISDAIEMKEKIAPNEIYAICKKYAHYLSLIKSREIGIRYIWMRFANLYGPRSINGNIVGYTITEIINGKEATFGPAQQMYDLLYIDDLVNGAFLLGDNPYTQGTYYIGSGHPKLLKEYLMEIGMICERSDLIKIGHRADDGTRYDKDWFKIDRIQKETEYRPRYTFKDGIIRTLEWLRKN